MVIYGGAKKYSNSQVEYNTLNHKFVNSIELLESKLQKYNNLNVPYVNLTDKINLSSCFIPNIQNIFYININPKKYFNVKKIITIEEPSLMILYLGNTTHLPSLLIDKDNHCDNSICNDYGYYYQLTHKISILDIYPIYNYSDKSINLCIFIIKKSFWYL